MFFKIFNNIGQNHPRLPQLQQRSDQREHDVDVPIHSRSQDGPQLRLEHRQITQTEPNAPQSQHGIVVAVQRCPQDARDLVGTNVQGANDHW